MQQAIPDRNSHPVPTVETTATSVTSSTAQSPPPSDSGNCDLEKLVRENAVIVFGRRGCCMCHVVKLLFLGLGVNPTISDFDDDQEREPAIVHELSKIISTGGGDLRQPEFPAVFVGGKLFGGLEKVMATHISGELVPILKDAGALWL